MNPEFPLIHNRKLFCALLAVCFVLAAVCPVAGGAAPQPDKAIIDMYTLEWYYDYDYENWDLRPILCDKGILGLSTGEAIHGKPITSVNPFSEETEYGFRFETTMDAFLPSGSVCVFAVKKGFECNGADLIHTKDMDFRAYYDDDGSIHCGDAYYISTYVSMIVCEGL